MVFRGFTFTELLIALAVLGLLMALLTPILLRARQAAEEHATLAHAQNVLKAAWAHVAQDAGASPVGGNCTDGFRAGSYSVPDPGPGVASCQLTWRDGLPQVEVRSRSGRSFTLP